MHEEGKKRKETKNKQKAKSKKQKAKQKNKTPTSKVKINNQEKTEHVMGGIGRNRSLSLAISLTFMIFRCFSSSNLKTRPDTFLMFLYVSRGMDSRLNGSHISLSLLPCLSGFFVPVFLHVSSL
jgi:hypothetical protein